MHAFYASFWVLIGVVSIFFSSLVDGLNSNSLMAKFFNVFVPPSIHANISNITLIINDAAGNGFVNGYYIPKYGEFISFNTVEPSATLVLPGSVIPMLNGATPYGLRIECSSRCSVQMMVNSTYSNASEGTFLIPEAFSGSRYIINSDHSSGSFSTANGGTNIIITFPNGSQLNKPTDLHNGWSFSGPDLDGTIIKPAVFKGALTVSVGRDGSSTTSHASSYLWEHLIAVDYFDTDFIFVNPSGSGPNVTSTLLFFANGVNKTVEINVSGFNSFSLGPFGTANISTHNLTHFIYSNGSIDIQVVSGSYYNGNVTQFGLTPNTQFFSNSSFSVQPNSSSRLLLIAKTTDIKNSSNHILLNKLKVDLTSFETTANSSYSFSSIVPRAGYIAMSSNIDLAGYLFDSSNGKNFGSSIGRFLNTSTY